jgi:uncharacterized membrane-anchored protein YjiN (DUF445 family)
MVVSLTTASLVASCVDMAKNQKTLEELQEDPEIRSILEEFDKIVEEAINVDECFAGASNSVRSLLREQNIVVREALGRATIAIDDDNVNDAKLLAIVHHINEMVAKYI